MSLNGIAGSAISALKTNTAALNVVANNVSNLNTPGFKTNVVYFRDLVTQSLGAGLGSLVGGLFGAEACLYLAVAVFAVQMLVILMSQAVGLVRQPEMACD